MQRILPENSAKLLTGRALASHPPSAADRWPQTASILVIVAGSLVLLAWAAHVTVVESLIPEWIAMRPTSAACCVLAGLALWLSRDPAAARRLRLGRFCAGVLTAMAFASVAQYALRAGSTMEQIFFEETVSIFHPAKIPLPTGLCFLAVGVALLGLDWRTRSGGRPTQILPVLVTTAGLLATTGYLYGAQVIGSDSPHGRMAGHTAVAFVVLGLGILCARRDEGPLHLLTSDGLGGATLRRLLPLALTLPLLLGWLRLAGENQGFYEGRMGLVLFAMSNMAVFTILIWSTAAWLAKADDARRLAVEALRASESALQAASERVHLGGWQIALPTGPAVWSSQMFRLFGRDETLGPPDYDGFLQLVHPDDRPTVIAAHRAAIADGRKATVDFRSAPGRDELRHFSTVTECLRGPDGRAAILAGTVFDITERKLSALRIAHLNRVYAVLSDINHTIVRLEDPAQVFAAACRIAVEKGGFRLAWIGLVDPATGRLRAAAQAGAAENYVEMVIMLLNDPVDAQDPNSNALQTGEHVILNDVARDPSKLLLRTAALERGFRSIGGFPLVIDGQVRGVFSLYSGEPNFFDAEEVRLIDELAMDIAFALDVSERETARRAAEERLRANEERFRMLIENGQDIITVLDARGTVTYHSPSTGRLLGYDLATSLGRNIMELVHPEDLPKAQAAYREALQKPRTTLRLEFRVRHADSSWRVLESIGQCVPDAEGRSIVILNSRDVTESRVLEDQFRQAQKMEAIGTLAGGIAHDFNNILAAIGGYTELARMALPGASEVSSHLAAVLKATGRATDLVRQIMAFSRQQEQRRQPMQLARVIEEALGLLRATIPATVEFRGRVSREVASVLADPTQVHQLMMNLCTNAWHAIGEAPGSIEVNLGQRQIDETQAAQHPDLRPGTYVCLTVADSGCGMSAATLKRIFEPFFTTKEPGKGTGLGLSVVHGIMKGHDGAVVVQSTAGTGTTFDLYFPALPGTPWQEDVAAQPAPLGRGERILVVDNEDILAELVAKLLDSLGYRATPMTSALGALTLLRQTPDAFDLVITDLAMPRMPGTELALEIRRLRPSLPVILTTGFTSDFTEERARQFGIRELLPKPPTIHSLGETVHRVLAGAKPA